MSQLHPALYVRQGQIPFFRLPTVDVSQGPGAYRGAEVVVLGVPWDGGTTHQPGARFAPWEVRRVSAMIQPYHPVHEVDVFQALACVDGGNVMISPFSATAARELITQEIAAVLGAGALPFVVGGDHSVTLPILRAIAAVHGPVQVVQLDAHLDTSTGDLWGDDFHHGTPFRHALSEGLILQGGLHQVGIRGSFGDAEERAFGARHGAQVYGAELIEDLGIRSVATRIRAALGDRPTYLSFDVDGLDPASAPGTGTPVPGGLSAREVLGLLQALRGIKVVGMDVVEICPSRDTHDLTARLGAQLLYEGLALAAVARAR